MVSSDSIVPYTLPPQALPIRNVAAPFKFMNHEFSSSSDLVDFQPNLGFEIIIIPNNIWIIEGIMMKNRLLALIRKLSLIDGPVFNRFCIYVNASNPLIWSSTQTHLPLHKLIKEPN